jgi:uncharacterized membrane protein YdfJ with MMPL/SSD domain
MFFARRRRRVFAIWVVVILAGAGASGSLSNVLQRAFTAPGSDSAHGANALKRAFSDGGEYPFVLVATSPTPIAAKGEVVQDLERESSRVADHIPSGETHEVQVVHGHTAYTAITSADRSADLASLTPHIRKLISDVSPVNLLLTGTAALEYDSRQVLAKDLSAAEIIALPLAAIVLIWLLQTVIAALIPVVLALAVIPTSMGVLWLLAHVTDMSIYVTNVATLLGIALSLDYSLLVVSRLRDEEQLGMSSGTALERTLATAGRTAAFSAITVATGLAVLMFIPLPFMRSMGLAGVVVPLVAAVATRTLLPALLAELGPRINKGRLIPAAGYSLPTGRWTGALSRLIEKYPGKSFVLGALILAALLVPAAAIRVTGGDIRSLPLGMPSDRGQDALTAALGPGALTPYQVVLTVPNARTVETEQARLDISQLVFALSKDPEIIDSEASPIGSRTSKSGRVVEIGFIGHHAAGSAQAQALVKRIRHVYAGFRPPGSELHLAGAAGLGVDFVHMTYDRFLWISLAIVGTGLILLLYAFRSLVLPIKAVILNCMSVAASVGIVVLAVQTGVDSHLGLRHANQIEAWVPAFLIAVLFGLSVDYHIFIVARIREEWQRCGSTDEAVQNGLKHTSRVVRAAAAVMVVTFAGFINSSFADVQKLGIGLSFGIALDVLLVRSLLLPSAMRAIGRWNWYFPGIARGREASIATSHVIGETSD